MAGLVVNSIPSMPLFSMTIHWALLLPDMFVLQHIPNHDLLVTVMCKFIKVGGAMDWTLKDRGCSFFIVGHEPCCVLDG